MKQKYLLLSMIPFIFLVLFSATSLALIPGDFGSANNGPPDGCVDFEDLMIFAMAYGSTPSDSNWNPSCDIAGPGGSLIPDGVIDFEDLMVFAMHYGEGCGSTNHAPEITSSPITTATVDVLYNYNVNATDPDGDTLTYSLTTKPTGMTINSSTGLINWTPSLDQVGDNSVSVKVSDDGFPIKTDTQNFIIKVNPAELNPIVRRALLIGVGDYKYFPDAYGNIDLQAPPYNVDMMHDTLSHSGSGFFSISELMDLQATKAAILNGIATAFSGADSDDVSYFYFTGHGINSSGVSYLCPTNVSYYSPLNSYISTNELESALSAIPGTKVVILDCCHSGGFIGKQMQEEKIISNAREFNDNVINSFLSRDLTSSQYKVLTSCLSTQVCVELIPAEGDPFGLFSGVLCEGCGYDTYIHPYPADGNGNGEITLHEAYTYTDETVNAIATELNFLYDWNIDQDTQVYPLYSDFVIIEE